MENMLYMVFFVSILAGFIDAIAGGGGLIMLPALMLAGLPPGAAVATNKLFNVASSFTSAVKFWRAGTIQWRLFAYMIVPSLLGAVIGSKLIGELSREAAEPLISALLILVALIVIMKPEFGSSKKGVAPSILTLGTAGLLIGIHDGFFGPGAGIFLIFTLINLGGSSFLGATSTAKIVNLLTSAIALAAFIKGGQVNWSYGIAGSLGITIGSYLGARNAGLMGTRLIRPVFLCMALAIAVKIII